MSKNYFKSTLDLKKRPVASSRVFVYDESSWPCKNLRKSVPDKENHLQALKRE
jgi:hypothetical protein